MRYFSSASTLRSCRRYALSCRTQGLPERCTMADVCVIIVCRCVEQNRRVEITLMLGWGLSYRQRLGKRCLFKSEPYWREMYVDLYLWEAICCGRYELLMMALGLEQLCVPIRFWTIRIVCRWGIWQATFHMNWVWRIWDEMNWINLIEFLRRRLFRQM